MADAVADADNKEPPPPRSAAQRLVDLNERAWALPVDLAEQIGAHLVLFGQAAFWLMRRPFRVGVFVDALEFIGVESLLIVGMVGMFVGMVFALQLVAALRQFGAESYIGATLGLALTRELAPVFTSIVVAARAGAGMATELGSMRITEQVDALATLAVNPVQYLITPRILGALVMVPMLTLLFDGVGMAGGYGVAVYIQNVDGGTFVENARWVVDTRDILQGLTKALIFGGALSLISCYQGYNAKGGAKGVGIGTTRAVVGSFVTILVLDYFLTDIILALQHV